MTDTPAAVPTIRRLTIDRFRRFEHFEWLPAEGVNVIVGGGDVGKSTVLEAIALLLNPTNATLLSDADYFNRDTTGGFVIEAVMSLPPGSEVSHEKHAAFPWEWDGTKLSVPDVSEPRSGTIPVYRLRVSGSDDLELSYELVEPDETTRTLSVAVRRGIGLVRLSGDDRNDRDLRLVQGSSLDKLIGDKQLRSRIAKKLGQTKDLIDLQPDAKERLKELDVAFLSNGLPGGLDLGVTSGQGISINALIGITADKNGAHLPLTSWGSGTRRLAALEIAAANQSAHPVVVVDEVERGLEPYRQRLLISGILRRESQVFVTTHSPIVLASATAAALWYLDITGTIGGLSKKQESHRLREPEGYLARLAVIAEGDTEIGFVRHLLRTSLSSNLDEHGIVVTNGWGNSQALTILDSLSAAKLAVAGFVDMENEKEDCWKRVKGRLGDLLFRWEQGCIEDNILPLVPNEELEAFITPPKSSASSAGLRLRTIAERLDTEDKSFGELAKHPNFRSALLEAAKGRTPADLPDALKNQWKSHQKAWFKSVAGGEELAAKVLDSSFADTLKPQLQLFIEAIREKAIPQKVADAGE